MNPIRPALTALCLLCLLWLAGCTTLVATPQRDPPTAAAATAAWARVLQEFVNDRGEVDFPRWPQRRLTWN